MDDGLLVMRLHRDGNAPDLSMQSNVGWMEFERRCRGAFHHDFGHIGSPTRLRSLLKCRRGRCS